MSQMDDFKKEKRCLCVPIESRSCYNCICYYCTGVVCPWRKTAAPSAPHDMKPGRCWKCNTGKPQRIIFDCDSFTAYRYKRLILPRKISPKIMRYDILLKRLEKIEQLLSDLKNEVENE